MKYSLIYLERITKMSRVINGISANTKVLTTEGFKEVINLSKDDIIVSENSIGATVLDIQEEGYTNTNYIILEDGRGVELADSYQLDYVVAKSKPKLNTNTVDSINIPDNTFIKIKLIDSPYLITVNDSDLIPPYTMGVLLGNGYCNNYNLEISSPYDEVYEKIASELTDDKLRISMVKEMQGTKRALIVRKEEYSRNRDIKNSYREKYLSYGLGGLLANSKFIPDEYLYKINLKQRIELIRGLLDTDGNVAPSKSIRFNSVSYKLAKGLQYLIWSIGGRCTLKKEIKSIYKENNQDLYWLYINYIDFIKLFTVGKKLDRLKDRRYLPNKDKWVKVSSIEKSGKEVLTYSITLDKDVRLITNTYIGI